MKKLILFPFLIFLLSGCTKEQKQENCLVGTWTNGSSVCLSFRQYNFNADGSGVSLMNNCGQCQDGADWQSTANFTWQVTSSGLTLNFGDSFWCNDPSSSAGTVTFDFNCDEDVLVVNSLTFTRQ